MLQRLILIILILGIPITTWSKPLKTRPNHPSNSKSNPSQNALAETEHHELLAQAEKLYRAGEFTEAAKLFRSLAEQGNPQAQTQLGTLILQGQGVEKNLEEGVAWYVKAANQGSAEAQNKLGLLFNLTKDFHQASYWFRKAALLGFPDAEFNLAVMYEKGEGVNSDPSQAVLWYRRAAAAGHERAKKHLIRLGYTSKGEASSE